MPYESPSDMLLRNLKEKAKTFKIAGFIVGVLFILFLSITIIPEGSRGLKFNMGKLDSGTLNPGVQFAIPFFQSIEKISIQPEELEVDVEVGTDGAITKDNQTVGSKTKLFYSNDGNKLHHLWQNIGRERMQSIVHRTSQEAFKTVIGKYTIFDVAANQGAIRDSVIHIIKKNLKNYPVTVTDYKITNYDWSDQFDRQIQATMERAQQVRQKQQELLVSEQEAQKQVKQAEARKQARVLEAEGNLASAEINAKAKAKEGEGLRNYYATIGPSIQFELEKARIYNKQLEVQKWNGQYVPTNHYGPIPVSAYGLNGPGGL
jgi:regulator of protease activity HflC (stomatin/prohibitin superfamily)